MKRILLITVTLLTMGAIQTTKAQFNSENLTIGPGLFYETNISNIGINVGGIYEFNDLISGSASFTYYLKKEYTKLRTLDLNIHYNLTQIPNIGSIYAIGGFDIGWIKSPKPMQRVWDGTYYIRIGGGTRKHRYVGVNLGAGSKIKINDIGFLHPELNIVIGNGSVYFKIGARFLFNI